MKGTVQQVRTTADTATVSAVAATAALSFTLRACYGRNHFEDSMLSLSKITAMLSNQCHPSKQLCPHSCPPMHDLDKHAVMHRYKTGRNMHHKECDCACFVRFCLRAHPKRVHPNTYNQLATSAAPMHGLQIPNRNQSFSAFSKTVVTFLSLSHDCRSCRQGLINLCSAGTKKWDMHACWKCSTCDYANILKSFFDLERFGVCVWWKKAAVNNLHTNAMHRTPACCYVRRKRLCARCTLSMASKDKFQCALLHCENTATFVKTCYDELLATHAMMCTLLVLVQM